MLIPLSVLLYSIEKKYKFYTTPKIDENVLVKTMMITEEHDYEQLIHTDFDKDTIYFCNSTMLLKALESDDFNYSNVAAFFVINNSGISKKNPQLNLVPAVLFDETAPFQLLNEVLLTFTSLIRWDKSIHEKIINNCVLADLMESYSTFSKYPLLIFDIEFQVIASFAGNGISSEHVNNIINQGYASEDMIRKMLDLKITGSDKKQDSIIKIESLQKPGKYNLWKQFRKNGKPVALAFLCCESKTISPRFISMINLFFNNLSFYFSNSEKYDRIGIYLHEYVMNSLLKSKNSIDFQRLSNYMKTLELPMEGSFWLIKISVEESENIRLAYLRKLINDYTYMTTAFLYDDGLYALISSKKPLSGIDINFINSAISIIKNALPNYDISFYISNPFEKIESIYDAHIQCSVLEQLHPILTRGQDNVHRYDDYIIEHLIAVLSGQMDLESILPMNYKAFKQWDKEEKHGLYETLDQFLIHNCDYKASSETLGIHRNTMSNRIQTIENHFGIDFNDNITRLKFTLAFTIDKYINDTNRNTNK